MTLSQAFSGLPLGISWVLETARDVFESQTLLILETEGQRKWKDEGERVFPYTKAYTFTLYLPTHKIIFSTQILSWSI